MKNSVEVLEDKTGEISQKMEQKKDKAMLKRRKKIRKLQHKVTSSTFK